MVVDGGRKPLAAVDEVTGCPVSRQVRDVIVPMADAIGEDNSQGSLVGNEDEEQEQR